MDRKIILLYAVWLIALLAAIGCVIWALWKWLNWKWCERSAEYSLFYRVCRVRYGIVDSGDLTSEENQRYVQEVAQGYERFAHYSIEQLGQILDRQKPQYETLRRQS